MKTWVVIVLILIFLFVVVPLIIYGISVNAATKVMAANQFSNSTFAITSEEGCASIQMARPPEGMEYVCKNNSWVLVSK